MLRVSIEVPDIFKYRLQPIVDLRRRFAGEGVLVGFDLKSADLRILNNDMALQELAERRDKSFDTPVIIDERIDGAQIINTINIRSLMAHPDVRFWLKRNAFRDSQLYNRPFVGDRYHYQMLNEMPEFHVDATPPQISMPVTAEMAAKIRLLPTVSCDRFSYFRDQQVDWSQKRPIDVSFAGLVDYEVRATDYWDGKLAEALAASDAGIGFMPNQHRRAAAQQLTQLRHLRVVIGMNRALQADLYQATLMRSSISVSPWGFGEYGYRDYESILAGCVMIKPLTDHVETFAPDIYQSGKYYVACKADFSDLPDLVDCIMSDRGRAIDLARRARQDMLAANTPEAVYSYYLDLFKQALGETRFSERALSARQGGPVLSLQQDPIVAVRAEIEPGGTGKIGNEALPILVLKEDSSPQNSHDIRLFAGEAVPPGLYRVRVIVRPKGRKQVAVQLHLNFAQQIWLSLDLETLTAQVEPRSPLFKHAYGPELTRHADGWTVLALAVEITEVVPEELGLTLYTGDDRNHVYDGDGRAAVEVAALDLTRIDLRG